MNGFLLNLALAAIWAGLMGFTALNLLIGFGLGMVLLALFGGILHMRLYTSRLFWLLVFGVRFFKELALSSLQIGWIVLTRPISSLYPNILAVDVEGLSDMEILILSQSISLTPGTTTIDLSKDHQILYVHALDAKDPQAVRESIRKELLEPMLRFTR